jgi:hypothetical protein
LKELEDVLKHYGALGMKWGRRKQRNERLKELGRAKKETVRKLKRKEITRKQAKQEMIDNLHKYTKGNKYYDKEYSIRVKQGQSHNRAVRGAHRRVKVVKASKIKIGVAAAIIGAKVGSTIVKKSYNVAISPESIRMGKNIMMAAQRSPLRYVDGSKMTNILNL